VVARSNQAVKTRDSILAAARDLVVTGATGRPTVGEVATRAGVSRLSVYHHFGSHSGLLEAVAAHSRRRPLGGPGASAVEQLRAQIREASEHWARDPALFRRLPGATEPGSPDQDRGLAQRLASEDRLRPGCSLKEAEDVIGLLTAFPTFDRLHQGGRRSVAAVVEILVRMAGAVVQFPAQSPA
jgi:AcrR family transcriptional regulator